MYGLAAGADPLAGRFERVPHGFLFGALLISGFRWIPDSDGNSAANRPLDQGKGTRAGVAGVARLQDASSELPEFWRIRLRCIAGGPNPEIYTLFRLSVGRDFA